MTRKQRLRAALKDTVTDLVGALLYYDRKEDEGLDRTAMADMFQKGWASADEIKRWFSEALDEQLPNAYEVAASQPSSNPPESKR